MANSVTILPAPVRRRPGFSSGEMGNFLLSLGSLKEQKAATALKKQQMTFFEKELDFRKKVQETDVSFRNQQLAVNESLANTQAGNLALNKNADVRAQAAHDALANQRSYDSLAASYKTQLLNQRMAEAKRNEDVERTLPGNDTKARDGYSALKKAVKQNRPLVEEYLFSEEIQRVQNGVMHEQRAQIYAGQAELAAVKQQQAAKEFVTNKLYETAEPLFETANKDDVVAMNQAILSGDLDSYGKLYSKMTTTRDAKKRSAAGDFKATDIPNYMIQDYGLGTFQRMQQAERLKLPYEDIRTVYAPKMWGPDVQKQLDRTDAKKLNVEQEWLDSAPRDMNKVKPKQNQQSTPQNRIKSSGPGAGAGAAIRSRVNEKAKTIKPAGSTSSGKTGNKTSSSKDAKLGDRRVTVEKDGKQFTVPMKQLQQALDAGYKKVK